MSEKKTFAEKMLDAGEKMEDAGRRTAKRGDQITKSGCGCIGLIILLLIIFILAKAALGCVG